MAYPLHDCYFSASGVSRTDSFGYDPDFAARYESYAGEYQADLHDYAYYQGTTQTHSKGHQMPSADRNLTDADNRTTFYATNMTPQLQTLNGGAWMQLEDRTRTWASTADTLYVVTGAHFDTSRTPVYVNERWKDDSGNSVYGTRKIPVPTHYYKVLLRKKSGTSSAKQMWECTASELQCIGFVYDHAAGSWSSAAAHATSVSAIETMVGFTFFANVPTAPKTSYSLSDWGL